MSKDNDLNSKQFLEQLATMTSSVQNAMNEINTTVSRTMNEFSMNFNSAKTDVSAFNESMNSVISIQTIASTAISAFSFILGLLSTAMSFADESQKKLNVSILKNPYVLAAAGIATVIGVLAGLANSMDTTTIKHNEVMEAINKEIVARDDLASKQQDHANANISELNNVQGLNKELMNLVDADGKVSAKNKDRAEFIVSVLNKALGEQIKIEEGVISGYDNSSNVINDKIAKLKAEAILEAQLPIYKKALVEATNAQIKADEMASQISDLKIQKKGKEAELEAQYGADWRNEALKNYDIRLTDLALLDVETKKKEEEFKKQSDLSEGYYEDISLYETNAALIASENAENYAKVQMESAITKANTVEEKKIALQTDIEAEKSHIEQLKSMKALETDEQKQVQLQSQIEAAEMKLKGNEEEVNQLIMHGQQIAELKQVDNANDLSILGTYISDKQAKLAEMYAIDESKWTEEQKKEAEALKASIDSGLATYSQYAIDKVSKAMELSSKLNDNSTQEERDAAASAEREALATLEILGKNATDKLGILADLKAKRKTGEAGITDAMVKEAERQAIEAETKYGEVAEKVNNSWLGMSDESRKAFEDVMKPMLEEMEKKEEPLFKKANRIASGILESLKKSFDINSPSRKVKKIFQSVMEGAEVGLDDRTPDLMAQTEEIATNILDVFTTLNQSDLRGLVHKMQSVIDTESIHMKGIVNSNLSQEMYSTNKLKIEMPNLTGTIRGNIENHIMMDSRETAIQLSPFISEELAFTSR